MSSKDIFPPDKIDEFYVDCDNEDRPDERSDDEALECAPGNMYVLSNNGGIFGATGVLDEELFEANPSWQKFEREGVKVIVR